MTDVIGFLRNYQNDSIAVEKSDGSLVQVARADIVAAKPLPTQTPPPKRWRDPKR